MMRAGRAHKASQVLTAILVAGFVFVSSCTPEEQIVYVPMEVPADCPPSAPRGVYAVNLDGYVQICWYPNPEDDIVGYDIWKNDELYGTYEWIGTVDAEVTDPYEYCFEYGDFIATGEPVNGEQFYYAVSAYDLKDNLSELSYEDVSATPRPEGFLRLYDAAIYPDSCGYDFTNLNSLAQDCALPTTDLKFDTIGGVNLFSVAASRVMIQDYGYTYSFDDINLAPEDGWSLAGSAEAIESHCYILRLSESDGFHYVKLWVHTVANGYADFWWAYQTDPYNTDLLEAGGDEDGTNSTLTSGSVETGGIKIMNGFPEGRQVPPTSNSGTQDDDRILQRQNTLP
jgi:hypothetical protein